MESQPQNSEFRINPENFHPCITENQHLKKMTHMSTVIRNIGPDKRIFEHKIFNILLSAR